MTTNQKIERSREMRLWIGQVIVPAAAAVGVAMSNPEIRKNVMTTYGKAKNWVNNKINSFKKSKNG